MRHTFLTGGANGVSRFLFPSVMIGVSLLAGCASIENPQPTVGIKQVVETAPADLQLTCASEAATQLAGAGTTALPSSSRLLKPGVYQVDVFVAGSAASCDITSEGVILAITPKGAAPAPGAPPGSSPAEQS
ncbi:MAG: hypothetical protein AAGE61_04150 [Pseudomonadota bacterium]